MGYYWILIRSKTTTLLYLYKKRQATDSTKFWVCFMRFKLFKERTSFVAKFCSSAHVVFVCFRVYIISRSRKHMAYFLPFRSQGFPEP